jgi:hypothetical protein
MMTLAAEPASPGVRAADVRHFDAIGALLAQSNPPSQPQQGSHDNRRFYPVQHKLLRGPQLVWESRGRSRLGSFAPPVLLRTPQLVERPRHRDGSDFSANTSRARTKLIALSAAPFPYDGNLPGADKPFLNTNTDGRRGHMTSSGRVYWQDETYSDRRSLLHIPAHFSPNAPAAIALFFHGHGATLSRDVWQRQKLPAQISESGRNVVLVAPQFGVDARDSSVGNFWRPGALRNYLDEAATALSELYRRPSSRPEFARMPVIIFAYSGGFEAAAWALRHGRLGRRIKGVVLLDGLYNHTATFRKFIGREDRRFFINAYGTSTTRLSKKLEAELVASAIPFESELPRQIGNREVVSIPAPVDHRSFVTNAWTANPVADVIRRIGFVARTNPRDYLASSASREVIR